MLIGRLGRDPEIRFLPSGAAAVSFSLATSKKDKEKNTITQWHTIKAFGKLAESCGEFIHKGSQVFIEGEIEYREYTNKKGEGKKVTEIVAFNVQFIDKKEESK